MKPWTFRVVAKCLNQLRHRVHPHEICGVIKSNGKMGLACGTYIWGEEKCIQDFGGERDCLEDLDVDGKISKWVLNRMTVLGPKSCCFGYGEVAGCCEHCYEHAGSTKHRQLWNLQRNSAAEQLQPTSTNELTYV